MYRHYIYIVAFLALLALPAGVRAQEAASAASPAETAPAVSDTTGNAVNIQLRLLDYFQVLERLHTSCCGYLKAGENGDMDSKKLTALSDSLKSAERSLASFGVRWNAYYQTKQADIAADENLLGIAARVQEMQQAVSDTLLAGKQRLDSFEAFDKAETLIFSQDSTYKRLYKEAMALTLSGKLAAQLEKVKAQEQVVFADIEAAYSDAKTASEAIPALKKRMEAVEAKYVELKNVSAKVQEAAYKPFIQRIKDYLLGFAAVAILLMFVNLMSAKVKTLKDKRDQALKMKNMLKKDKQYPTI